MGLLDDLKTPKKKVWPCLVATIAATLELQDAKIFLDACDNPEWKYATLETELKKRNIVISDLSIRKHRLRNCSCGQKNA